MKHKGSHSRRSAFFAGVPMTGNVSRSWDTEGTDDTDFNVIVCDL